MVIGSPEQVGSSFQKPTITYWLGSLGLGSQDSEVAQARRKSMGRSIVSAEVGCDGWRR